MAGTVARCSAGSSQSPWSSWRFGGVFLLQPVDVDVVAGPVGGAEPQVDGDLPAQQIRQRTD